MMNTLFVGLSPVLLLLFTALSLCAIGQDKYGSDVEIQCEVHFHIDGSDGNMVYLKQRGIGVIDSAIVADSRVLFAFPTEGFSAFSLNIREEPGFFEWIFPEKEANLITMEIHGYDRQRTFVDAGLRQDIWQEGLVELTDRFQAYTGELISPSVPRYQDDLESFRGTQERELLDVFRFYFSIDETVGYCLTGHFINSLRRVDASSWFIGEFLDILKGPVDDELLMSPYVRELFVELDGLNTSGAGG